MEPVSTGETYTEEIIDLGFSIAAATPKRVITDEAGNVIKEFTVANGGITVTDAANGVYTVSKWVVDLPANIYKGNDRLIYNNGDVDIIWDLTLTVSK